MKNLLKLLLLIVFVLAYGCTNENKEDDNKEDDNKDDKIVVNETRYAFLEETFEITLPEEFSLLNQEENKWENSNELIAFFEEEGKLFVIDKGQTTITVTNKNYVYKLNLEILERADVNKEIDVIIRYIRDNMKSVGENPLNVVTSMEGYDFEVSYVSLDPESLDLDGTFIRGLIDKYVNFTGEITYKGITRNFPIPIKVEMIPSSEQKQVIETFLKEETKDIIESESGKLPTKVDAYGLNVVWESSYPGIIDSKNIVHTAYENVEIRLSAHYKVAGKEEVMELKYISKGVSEEEKSLYIDRVFKDLIPEEAGKQLNLFYGKDVEIIQDFIYPGDLNQLRPGSGKNGTKMPGGPQYVVIHDTGMTQVGDNADGLNEFIHYNANNADGRVASWHFSIDDTKAYQHVPTDEIAWHAGDGSSRFGQPHENGIGGGNQNGIGIETCINPGNDYEKTLKRTAKLTASLLHQYGLQLDRIKQHYDFSRKNCPQVIRNSGWMWDVFLKDVEIEYFLMMISDDIKVEWTVSDQDVVLENGLIVTPIMDKTINLTLKLTIDGNTKTYEYNTFVKGLSVSEKLSKVYFDLYINKIPRSTSSSITLPTEYEDYGAHIEWESNMPDVLDANGIYTKPNEEKEVKLKLTISIGEEKIEKEISIKVN